MATSRIRLLATRRCHMPLRGSVRFFSNYQNELEKQLVELKTQLAEQKNGHRHLSNVWETTESEKNLFTAGICGTSCAFVVALATGNLTSNIIVVSGACIAATLGPKVVNARFFVGLRDRPFRTSFATGISMGIFMVLGYYFTKKKWNNRGLSLPKTEKTNEEEQEEKKE